MLTLIKKIFIWWNQDTFGTRLKTIFFGKFVGKDEFVIEGITTTIPLHKKLLNHKKFINSDFNVSWLDKDSIV